MFTGIRGGCISDECAGRDTETQVVSQPRVAGGGEVVELGSSCVLENRGPSADNGGQDSPVHTHE